MVFVWMNAFGECVKKRYYLLYIVNFLCGFSGVWYRVLVFCGFWKLGNFGTLEDCEG